MYDILSACEKFVCELLYMDRVTSVLELVPSHIVIIIITIK